jgi:hypothetical protein
MAAYNAEQTVASAIDSALAQTYADIEVVVVDDGSTDRTGAVAAAMGDERVRVLQQPNRGPSAARNAGIRAAQGELVSVLDADDLWLPTYVETMVKALDGAPQCAFAWGDAWVYDLVSARVRVARAMAYQNPPLHEPTDPDLLVRELLDRNFIYGSTTIRRSVLVAVGGYSETLTAAEDYDLWLRIAMAGHCALRIQDDLSIYRRQPGTNNADEPRVLECLSRLLDSAAAALESSPELAAVARARAAGWRRERRKSLLARTYAFRPVVALRRGARGVVRKEEWLAPEDVPVAVRGTLQRSDEVELERRRSAQTDSGRRSSGVASG